MLWVRCKKFICESNHCGAKIVHSVLFLFFTFVGAVFFGTIWFIINRLTHLHAQEYCTDIPIVACFFVFGIGTELLCVLAISIAALIVLSCRSVQAAWKETEYNT